jgi:anti-anti-sigma factor
VTPGLEANWRELDPTTALVTLAGELDLAGAGELEPPIADRLSQGSVIVDLSDLEFIDSAGLGVLYTAQRSAKASARGFAVVHGSSRGVATILELTNASSQIPLFSSIAAAKASL